MRIEPRISTLGEKVEIERIHLNPKDSFALSIQTGRKSEEVHPEPFGRVRGPHQLFKEVDPRREAARTAIMIMLVVTFALLVAAWLLTILRAAVAGTLVSVGTAITGTLAGFIAGRAAATAFDATDATAEVLVRVWSILLRTLLFIILVSTVALVGIAILDIFREVDADLIQIMLTVVTTILGIGAGFITGRAVGTTSNR